MDRYQILAKSCDIDITSKEQEKKPFIAGLYAHLPDSLKRYIQEPVTAFASIGALLGAIQKFPGKPDDVQPPELGCPFCVSKISWSCERGHAVNRSDLQAVRKEKRKAPDMPAPTKEFERFKKKRSFHCDNHPDAKSHNTIDCILNKSKQVKEITKEEKRCFKCNAPKWTREHVCDNKKLNLLKASSEENDKNDKNEINDTDVDEFLFGAMKSENETLKFFHAPVLINSQSDGRN